jgi:hypothetical protein
MKTLLICLILGLAGCATSHSAKKAHESVSVSIIGNVAKTGSHQIDSPAYLLRGLESALGRRDSWDFSFVDVKRVVDGDTKIYRVDIRSITPDQWPLEDGDIISIPWVF